MDAAPAGIPDAHWLATPVSVRALILAQQQEIQALRRENDELRSQLTALATELANLRERIGRSSHNSSKPPSGPPESLSGTTLAAPSQPGLLAGRTPSRCPRPQPLPLISALMPT